MIHVSMTRWFHEIWINLIWDSEIRYYIYFAYNIMNSWRHSCNSVLTAIRIKLLLMYSYMKNTSCTWIILFIIFLFNIEMKVYYMEASETKWVNLVLHIIGVNSLRLGGLYITITIVSTSKWMFLNTYSLNANHHHYHHMGIKI